MPRIHLLLMLGALLLCSCSGPNRAEQAAREGVLLMGNGAEPAQLDPHIVTGIPEFQIIRALFEGLVTFNPEDLSPAPSAAASWDVSPDGLVYTFHLRPAAKWSNGEPVTAGDFVYGWRRALTPTLACEYSYLLHCVKNAKAFNEGKITDFSEVGIKALDDHAFEVTLQAPTAHFLSMLIMPVTFPVHRVTIEKFGKIDERNTMWTQAPNLVSNGPFTLQVWKPQEVVEVVRNEHYWDSAQVRLNGINFFTHAQLQTEERLFRTGALHITDTVSPQKIAAYQGDERLRINPYFGTYAYKFNTTKPPFDDRRVRLAFAMAIDRESIVNDVTKGGETAARHYTPPGISGYTAPAGIEYNPEKARQLLAEAGYPDGEGFPKVELLYNTQELHKTIAEAAQDMWLTNLKVQVTLLNQDWKVYLDNLHQLNFNIVRSTWIGDYLDPANFLDCFRSDSGNNNTGWKSAEYDALLDQAAQTLDQTERFELLQQAEALLMQEAPVGPVYTYTKKCLMSPYLKNKNINLLDYWFYKDIYLEAPDK